MIIGAHSILYSANAEADRAFLRDVLGLPHVDVGGGWLVFGLPPAEVAIHPGEEGTAQEFYFMTADVEAFAALAEKGGASCSPRRDMDWGVLTELTLPSGARVGVYQPKHKRPKTVTLRKAKRAARKIKKKAVKAKKKAAKAAKKAAKVPKKTARAGAKKKTKKKKAKTRG